MRNKDRFHCLVGSVLVVRADLAGTVCALRVHCHRNNVFNKSEIACSENPPSA